MFLVLYQIRANIYNTSSEVNYGKRWIFAPKNYLLAVLSL